MTTLRAKLLAPVAIILFVGACQTDIDVSRPGHPDKAPYLSSQIWDGYQTRLATLYAYSEIEAWDAVTGIISLDTASSFTGHPRSWGPDYTFTVEYEPPAGPVVPTETVDITIHVPRNDWNVDYAVYMFEPDGTEFAGTLRASIWYPPWLPEVDTFDSFCFFRVTEIPEPYYGMSDYRQNTPIVETLNGAKCVRLEMDHFSRWALEDGKGAAGGGIRPVVAGQSGHPISR
ncbi:hypothetical protein H8E07_06505 [bacterium]|nr:hypothetical protein [bacterium]